MSERAGYLHVHDMSVHVWEDTVEEKGIREVYGSILAGLRGRGFATRRDPDVERRWPTLAPWNHVGEKRGIEFHANTSGRHIELSFFQNVNRGPNPNSNGGRYDFDKFARLPRYMRLHAVAEVVAVLEKLRLNYGYALSAALRSSEPLGRAVLRVQEGRLDEGDALGAFNRSWSADRFVRGPDGWPAKSEFKSWPYYDRDGIELQSGDVRYARVDGRLVRGTAHPGVNGQWFLVSHGESLGSHLHAKALFRCEHPELEPRRLVLGQPERLHRELEKLTKARSYRRVAAVGATLARLESGAAA
ncbi:MAG TPA: hypothetical protein VH062_01950 [Polyangiaceae bacterium]|jgi:hypothetical protein|nr:hypothetical protein [Polyangiaceae bacterium]